MITSFIPGRVRIRDERFKDQDTATLITGLIKEHPAVSSATANTMTGGILIEYDPEQLDTGEACQALEAIDPEISAWIDDYEEALVASWRPFAGMGGNKCGGPSRNKAELAILTGSFLVCLASGFLRSKNLHIYSGLALAGASVEHVYKHRRRYMAAFQGGNKG